MKLFKKYMSLVLLFYTTIGTDALQQRFDYNYYPELRGSIKLHRVPVSWHEARLRCHYEGAVLASPTNVKFLKIMKNIISENQVQSCGVFTGIHSVFYKGVYSSIEGVPLSRIPVTWAPNEPDNYQGSENCLMMLVNGTMADVKCTDNFPFMCYKKNEDLLLSNCGTLDPGYTLEIKTGSCYKFHLTGEIWSKAYMICASEGGHLAIINSEEEAQVINNIFAKYPEQALPSLKFKSSLLIGFNDWGENGSWFTIHGETLEQAGYGKWVPNQPDNLTLNGFGESCGSYYRSAGLDDFWCNVKAVFICEKSPTSLFSETSSL